MLTVSASRCRSSAGAFLVCALTWFAGLEDRGLLSRGEGRYADIAREMLDSNDWVTPRLNGIKYLEKPPLQYWATAGAYAVLGVDEWTARLWPAYTGFLGIALMAFAGFRLAPRSPWLPTALTAAGCWGYFLGGQFLTLDMGLTFFLTVAMLSFVLSRRPDVSPSAERSWMILAWAAVACAALSKGIVGIVIPGLALLVYIAVERDVSLLRRLHWVPGLCVFGAIVLPWFILVQQRNPEFFPFFFIREHSERAPFVDGIQRRVFDLASRGRADTLGGGFRRAPVAAALAAGSVPRGCRPGQPARRPDCALGHACSRRALLFGAARGSRGRREKTVSAGAALLQRGKLRSERPLLSGPPRDAGRLQGRARAGYRSRAWKIRRVDRGVSRALGRARRSFRDHDAASLREAQAAGAPRARPGARYAPDHCRETLAPAACVALTAARSW